MLDHDQRFKILIQHFFADFLRLFFASWAERLDASAAQWIDKEVFPDPPTGPRRALDLVAQLPTRQAVPGQRPGEPEQWLALVHIEIESPDKATPLRPRMFRSYVHLRDKHGLPVLPIGLFLNVGLEGLGIDVYEEHFWELQPIRFEYLYVGLPALDAVQYVQGDNWLGVALAALMRIPKEQAAWLGAEALRRLKDAPLTEQSRFLLGECVQAYLPLDEEQRREFDKLVATKPYQGVQAMNKTWFEQGVEKGLEQAQALNKTWFEQGVEQGVEQGLERGLEQGLERGRREILREQVEERFGPLPPEALDRLRQMNLERLTALGKAILHAQSLRELGLED